MRVFAKMVLLVLLLLSQPAGSAVSAYSAPQFGFTGMLGMPGHSLDFAAFRVYDPDLGKWLSRDPIGESGGLNLYRYANNDPINRVDPSGLCPQVGFAGGGGQFRDANTGEIRNGNGSAARDQLNPLNPINFQGGNSPSGVSAGRIAAKGAPITNPARLLTAGTHVPNAGGVIRSFAQKGDQIYYRVFSGSQQGRFLTAVPPGSSAFAREALALPSANQATFIQEVLVPNGTILQRSRALPAFGARGGAEQFELLQKIPKGNFGPGTPLP